MSGVIPLRAHCARHFAATIAMFATLFVVALLSGCSLFPTQAPAPIIDLSTPQPASEVDLTEPEEEPASAPVANAPSTEVSFRRAEKTAAAPAPARGRKAGAAAPAADHHAPAATRSGPRFAR
jgi:hypothetical protein